MILGIFGMGMYSTGRGTEAFGTIFPAALQTLIRDNLISSIVFFGQTAESERKNIQILTSKLFPIFGDSTILQSIEISSNLVNENAAWESKIKICKLDLAIVCTPDHIHFDILSALAECSVHSMCVKPLATKITELHSLIDVFEKQSLIGLVDFHKRFDKANLILRSKYSSGEMGRLYRINIDYAQPKFIPDEIFSNWAHKSNVFQYLGVHYVDQICFCTGAKVIDVTTFPVRGNLFREKRVYDQINVVIRWKAVDGTEFTSFHMTSWSEPSDLPYISKQNIEFISENGRYYSDQSNRGLKILKNGQLTIPNPYFCYNHDLNGDPLKTAGYGIKCIKFFINCVHGYRKRHLDIGEIYAHESSCSFQDCLTSTTILEIVNRDLLALSED